MVQAFFGIRRLLGLSGPVAPPIPAEGMKKPAGKGGLNNPERPES